jgi:GNAT superfamily N-acetyltransferase
MNDTQESKRPAAAPLGNGGPEPLKLVRVRASGSADIEALNAMMSASPSHVLLTQDRLPSANEGEKLFANLPSGARHEDKFLWCAWQQQRLVGCIEIIRHWPVRDVAYIGLLQVREAQMRLGLGMQILEMARQIARGWSGVRRLQLAVAENNAGAAAFWRCAGFRATGLSEQNPEFTAPLLVMERPLR